MNYKYLYPVTKKTFHGYAGHLFDALKKGESLTAVWVPMAGRRMWNKFIIENLDIFKEELPNFRDFLFVYIEPLDLTEEGLAGYLRLMGKSVVAECDKKKRCKDLDEIKKGAEIFDDEIVSYPKLLDHLKKTTRKIIDQGIEIVFFLGEFDELKFANSIFYNNLKSFLESFRPKLHFVFLVTEDLTRYPMTEKLGELNLATMENLVYVPLCQEEDTDYMLDYFSERLDCEFSKEQRELVKQVCGGHPYSIKAATRILSGFRGEKTRLEDLKEILMNHYEMLSVSRRLFNLRSEEEKEIIMAVAEGRSLPVNTDWKRLEVQGIIQKTASGSYRLFGELFGRVAGGMGGEKDKNTGGTNGKVYLDSDLGAICFNGSSIEEKFTSQEYNVLRSFLEMPGKLQSRDEIGEVLWGKESYEKYSDWAIDQVMSKLRKKLKEIGTTSRVVTVRGRGYKLVTS